MELIKRGYDITKILLGIGVLYLMTYTLLFFRGVREIAKKAHDR